MKLIALEGIHFGYGSHQSEILDDLSLVINAGECHCINGATGSGKSSLLHLMSGQLSRPFEGDVYREPSLLVGLVMQDPNAQVLRQNVGAEIAFGLENLGVAADLMVEKVQHSLRRVGLYTSLDTPVDVLSLGQKYRLMMAAQLVFNPTLLLLDEPWAQLDDSGVKELNCVLKSLLDDGVAIVMVEHNPSAFVDLVEHFWLLENGKLKAGQRPIADSAASVLNISASVNHRPSKVVAKLAPHQFRFVDQDPLFSCLQPLALSSGEIVALVGDNGAGKSSLLKTLAGIQANVTHLPITVLDKRPQLGIYGADLGLLMQRPNRQLFEQTVLAELQFSLKRFKLPLARAEQILVELGLQDLAECSPHKLSYGQQHIIALASLVCLRPKLLLLDDPFAGLDKQHVVKVVQLLLQLRAQGSCILLSSHRSVPFLEVDRYWFIESGYLRDGAEITEQANVG
ncbi:ATP-binding cassette domain-containing protein [Shewanella halifaxensis]|uniref:ATP-binding cassette domain-containing protein n=1 Tax=Shewanella halifaxensis TaxID=271098 RepID=UPI000D59C77E|nr:ABC transporter ATP-binding protein [Shewanella halifaxensis]